MSVNDRLSSPESSDLTSLSSESGDHTTSIIPAKRPHFIVGPDSEASGDMSDETTSVEEGNEMMLENEIVGSPYATGQPKKRTKFTNASKYVADAVKQGPVKETEDMMEGVMQKGLASMQTQFQGINQHQPNTKGKGVEQHYHQMNVHEKYPQHQTTPYEAYQGQHLGKAIMPNLNENTNPAPFVRKPSSRFSTGTLIDPNPLTEEQLRTEPTPTDNIARPKYDLSRPVRKGWVAWWSNQLGKGQIHDRRTEEVFTIYWQDIMPHYGALVPGVWVQFQFNNGGRFDNLYVEQGCETVMFAQAADHWEEYGYIKAELDARMQRQGHWY